MVLVVFLVAYIVRQRLDRLNRLSSNDLWRSWLRRGARIKAGHEGSVVAGILLVLAPALVLALVAWGLDGVGLRFVMYPIEALVLVLLMGAPGWRKDMEAYADAWQRGDMQAAWHHVQDRLPEQDRGNAMSPETMHLSVSRALMVAVFERYFLVVFWYVIGGIWLAVIARGAVALAEQWPQAAARSKFARAAELVGWIPVRLLACTFGVAGDLAGWSRKIREVLPGIDKTADQVLMTSANGSLTGYALDPERFARVYGEDWPRFGGRSLRAMRDLLSRSMLVWICGIALLVIAGLV